MDDDGKVQHDERKNIQAYYSSIIQEFRAGLQNWLGKVPPSAEIDEFEDRDLDALLLKVHSNILLANVDRTFPRATKFT